MTSLPTIFEQLMAASAHAAQRDTADPHWKGHIRGMGIVMGSSTDQVLKLLRGQFPAVLSCGQIMHRTGLTRSCVSWALFYLSKQGYLQEFNDPRNRHYHRYQAVMVKEVRYACC